MTPAVSVLLAVHNGEPELAEALESLRAQTFEDFELIVVDDGSTDATAEIVATYAAEDRRVISLRLATNLGVVAALNHGFAVATAPLVARHDADDVALPTRLERQVEVLDADPSLGVLACDYFRRHDDGRITSHRPPRTDAELRWHMLFGNVWPHPAVMFRRDLIAAGEGPYRNVPLAEDYDLWLRLLERTRALTVPEPLVIVRTHRNRGVSASDRDRQRASVAGTSAERIRKLLPGRQLTQEAVDRLRHCYSATRLRVEDLPEAPLLVEMFDTFVERERVSADQASRLRRELIARLLAASLRAGWRSPKTFLFLARADPKAAVVGTGRILKRLARRGAATARGPLVRRNGGA